ncbi:MAG: ogt2 [Microbacteriaceae bacterium]|jgi:methylated-DNA-[protein]-cysteine S-methyltransferase|nr:ogt2 [Microbacteriaceae bacterium]
MTTRHALVPTVLGDLTVVASGDAIVGLYFPGHWYLPPREALGERVEHDGLIDEAAAQLRDYLAGARTGFDLEVTTSGDPLQESVWAMLREIPFGETTTYGALAERLGNRALAQAVGQAVGHNPVSIIIPCHRVLGTSGKLTGFAGGLERKRFLLELEEPELAKAERLF